MKFKWQNSLDSIRFGSYTRYINFTCQLHSTEDLNKLRITPSNSFTYAISTNYIIVTRFYFAKSRYYYVPAQHETYKGHRRVHISRIFLPSLDLYRTARCVSEWVETNRFKLICFRRSKVSRSTLPRWNRLVDRIKCPFRNSFRLLFTL